ncbi:Transposase [Streptomyces sp. AVP053U2]|nr:Transposase [Streptomyces sp. AVP053U2]
MARPSPYSPEFREEAVQLALKSNKPIAQVARELEMNPETLRTWVRRHEREHGKQTGPARRGRAGPAQGTRTPHSRGRDGERLPKKMRGVLREGSPVASKYEFIETMRLDTAEYAYPVGFMCEHLGVSRSGHYGWRCRPDSATARPASTRSPAPRRSRSGRHAGDRQRPSAGRRGCADRRHARRSRQDGRTSPSRWRPRTSEPEGRAPARSGHSGAAALRAGRPRPARRRRQGHGGKAVAYGGCGPHCGPDPVPAGLRRSPCQSSIKTVASSLRLPWQASKTAAVRLRTASLGCRARVW